MVLPRPRVELTRFIPASACRPPQVTARIYDPALLASARTFPLVQSGFSQRFTREVDYAEHYARKLAETLGLHQLEMGVVEDGEGQTAFHATPTGWQGVVSCNRRSIKQVRETVWPG